MCEFLRGRGQCGIVGLIGCGLEVICDWFLNFGLLCLCEFVVLFFVFLCCVWDDCFGFDCVFGFDGFWGCWSGVWEWNFVL